MQLFSGRITCRVTGVFHIASNFLSYVKVNTSHFVHPSLGMHVDVKCMIWHNCGGIRIPPPLLFFYTLKQVTLTDQELKMFLLHTSVTSLRPLKSLPPHTFFFTPCLFFEPLFRCTLLFSRGISALKMALQMEMSHNKSALNKLLISFLWFPSVQNQPVNGQINIQTCNNINI